MKRSEEREKFGSNQEDQGQESRLKSLSPMSRLSLFAQARVGV